MIWVVFTVAAIITVFTATKLSYYADIIGKKTNLGGLMVGSILLAGATSLPELAASISAVLINAPDIAIGNVMGSNIFNTFNLAIIEPFCIAGPILSVVSMNHILVASLGMLLSAMAAVSILLQYQYTIWGIGIDSILIAITYVIGLKILNNINSQQNNNIAVASEDRNNDVTINKAIIGFAISAIIIIIAGVGLSYTGDKVATITGLSGSFVGSILIAMTTSLPETAAGIAAVRSGAYDMAVGNFMGSNTFNMLIILATDIFYRQGPILANVDTVHAVTAIFGLILSGIVVIGLIARQKQKIGPISKVSIIIVTVYLFAVYILYKGVSL